MKFTGNFKKICTDILEKFQDKFQKFLKTFIKNYENFLILEKIFENFVGNTEKMQFLVQFTEFSIIKKYLIKNLRRVYKERNF